MGNHSYWYDDLRQVTRHDRGDLVQNPSPELPSIDPATRQQQEVFTFDETGNWNSENIQNPALAQTRTHNPANQITGISGPGGAVQPAYDPAGNMTLMPRTSDWTAGDELTWDAWNRLARVRPAASSSSSSSGSSSSSSSSSSSEGHSSSGSYHSASSSSGLPSGEVHYKYDARTRRTRKANAAGTIDYYDDKQWRAIEEHVFGSVSAHYVWSPFDRWTMIRRKRGSEELYVLKDYLDPSAIINTSATVIERFGYDAFGPIRFMDADFEPRAFTAAAWNFLFHAEFLDEDTGLYNYGYRHYDPARGRWPSRDPIGERGGINLYGFVGNEAIMRIDILGLVNNRPVPCCEEEKILGEGPKRSLQAVELTRNDSVPADASRNRPSPRREYCGLICCHKYLSWIASTEPIAGSRTFATLDPQGGRIYNAHNCNPLQNGDCSQIYGEEWDTVSFYHSQPNQSIFSEADWAFVLHQGQFPLFLGTPDGEVLILGKLGNRRRELPNGWVIRKPAPIIYPVIPHPDFPNGGILGDGQSPLTFE